MRRIGIAVAAALGLLFAAVPASAANPSNSLIQGAEAVWYFDSANVATAVLIRPVQEKALGPGSTSKLTVGVNVQVEQLYIDPATGEEVFRLYTSEPYYAPATTISVDALKGASVTATITMFEQSGAAAPRTVNVSADWMPNGDKTHFVSNVWDSELGVASRSNESSVPAVATATVTGDLAYGALGETSGILASGKTFAMRFQPAIQNALMGMLVMAKAESAATYHITAASAGWTAGDARNTEVFLSVEQNHGRGGTGSDATTWVEIFGGYCDTANDQNVEYYYSSDRIQAPKASVDPSLQGATIALTFPVSGYEKRTPGCDFPTGDPTYTSVGPIDVDLAATWTATGQLVRNRQFFIEKTPDYSTRYRDSARVRRAEATATMAGPLFDGPLTNVTNALLYDETETRVTK